MIQKIQIKPLSVNKCWQGKRFKTKDYKQYEADCLMLLQKQKLPEAPYQIHFEFGASNKLSDADNFVKPFLDILQKKYGFDDRDAYRVIIDKQLVKKGSEYCAFKIETLPLSLSSLATKIKYGVSKMFAKYF